MHNPATNHVCQEEGVGHYKFYCFPGRVTFFNKKYKGRAGRFYIHAHRDSSGPPPLLKNECSLSVFQSFSPVHTKKLNNGNMIISLTGHVLYDVRDHVLKISVFVRLDKNDNCAFSKIPILGTVFIKLRFWFPFWKEG